MSVAVLSPQGQLTIPADILRKLGLRGGDKVVLAEQGNKVVISGNDTLDLIKASESTLDFWDNDEDRVWDNV